MTAQVNQSDGSRPWMKSVEMQITALRAATASATTRSAARDLDADCVRLLPISQPFHWSREMATAVWSVSRSIPDDARFDSELLDISASWWWFDWPLPIPMRRRFKDVSDDELDKDHICALLIIPRNDSISVVGFRGTPYGPLAASSWRFSINANLKALLASDAYDPLDGETRPTSQQFAMVCRFVLAAGAWLKQRIAVVNSGHVERHRRKQLQREYGLAVSDVKVVQLRRFDNQPNNQTVDTNTVDWSCRWVVNGHWRNQPYKHERRLIYIMPYVKGPSDKPLRASTATIYSVSR